MKMRVWYAAVLPVWLVYGEVNHHATAHKVLQQKLPCKSDVFLKGKFILQGNVKEFVAQLSHLNYTIKLVNNSTATLDYMRKVRTVFCPDFLTQS